MPWKASPVMDERLRFVGRVLDRESMSDVCREFGISPKTGYKIYSRYREHGLFALTDHRRIAAGPADGASPGAKERRGIAMPKKFDIAVVQTAAGEFTASVIRRRTSRGTTVERQQAGFTDRRSAAAWAQSELANYLAVRECRRENQKKSRKERRIREAVCEAWIEAQTLKSLAECIRDRGEYAISAKHALLRKAGML